MYFPKKRHEVGSFRHNYHIKYSQNFISSENLARKVVELTHFKSSDFVIEIGSGERILTRFLAERVWKVQAIEIDPKLSRVSKFFFLSHLIIKFKLLIKTF
jgi:16S rRNA A1518/A1519 N6-dimethyltransferase RsmA/KsgA/DIM1 with predicted DNA glycosylase/AP lyase activity